MFSEFLIYKYLNNHELITIRKLIVNASLSSDTLPGTIFMPLKKNGFRIIFPCRVNNTSVHECERYVDIMRFHNKNNNFQMVYILDYVFLFTDFMCILHCKVVHGNRSMLIDIIRCEPGELFYKINYLRL